MLWVYFHEIFWNTQVGSEKSYLILEVITEHFGRFMVFVDGPVVDLCESRK